MRPAGRSHLVAMWIPPFRLVPEFGFLFVLVSALDAITLTGKNSFWPLLPLASLRVNEPGLRYPSVRG